MHTTLHEAGQVESSGSADPLFWNMEQVLTKSSFK